MTILFICTIYFQMTELDCKVKVEYIVADFSSENQTQLYSSIAEKLSDKQIGLLGK